MISFTWAVPIFVFGFLAGAGSILFTAAYVMRRAAGAQE